MAPAPSRFRTIGPEPSDRYARVPFAAPSIGPDEIAEVVATLESGWLSTGPRVAEFELAFAEYVGARHAVAVNSCTAALHLSLIATGIGSGDEVITTPLTFCATANVVLHAGATPVFADIDPVSHNIDPAAVQAAITPRTRVLMPVHYAGLPADMTAFQRIAELRGLRIIEDAAHCVEGVANRLKVGSIADFTCFSFYATKNLTTGEGGMVTTNDTAAAALIRAASLHGMSRDAWARYTPNGNAHYDVVMPGFKYNMMDIQAAIGLHQLARLRRMHARRVAICAHYDAGLATLPLRLPAQAREGSVHARHLYPVLLDSAAAGMSRDELNDRLRDRGISTSIHFRPVHLHQYYQERFGFRRGMFPVAEAVYDATLSLPLSAAMDDASVDRVINACHDILR
ncbi:MAG TPA: DegT/DnrJ/EryC1/StrS family aminotransferase [Vicinamibacterales bacterium]|nr:DegT/DnrJ/EryC1/StrS family aminotransferase [Vicinamibacterales bacterium]